MEPSEGMYLTEKSHNEAYPLPNIVGSSQLLIQAVTTNYRCQ